MGRSARPFRGSAALAGGHVTRHRLRSEYQRVFRDVYVARDAVVTPRVRALAAACFCDGDGVLVGRSAAAMYGTQWLDPNDPAEVVRSNRCRAPKGMINWQYAIAPDEVVTKGGMRITTPARTAFDLARLLPRRDAIPIIDALCRATDLGPAALLACAHRHAGIPGVARVRGVLRDVDAGAESPPESHLRLALIDAGLPRPKTQVFVLDEGGGFIARCDLGWPEWKVIVEYDGDGHWGSERRAADIERYELIASFGWTVVRVTDKLLYHRTSTLIDRVTERLRAAGAPV